MKTCPVCKARCFDDMEVCYGCMHRFAEGETAFDVPVEDATPVAEMPLRPAVVHAAPPPGAEFAAPNEAPQPRARAVRREAPRVFGARDEDDPAEGTPAFGDAGAARITSASAEALRDMPRLELMSGPLAVAPLGGGYRLVVSIERG